MSAAAPLVAAPRVVFDEDVASRRVDDDEDYSGWFCVATGPWPCPVAGCGFVARHLTAAHLVVVWPRRDDPALEAAAVRMLEGAYEEAMREVAYWRGQPSHALGAGGELIPLDEVVPELAS